MTVKNVAIIGVGLIGGSLGMALHAGGAYRVTGIGRDRRKLALARRQGAVDDVTTDIGQGVMDADIVVLGVPVDRIGATLRRAVPHLKDGAVVTDVGSVKGRVLRDVRAALLNRQKRFFFVGGHPMAGSERAGVRFARRDLFQGATVVLTTDRATPPPAVRTVGALWRAAGARVLAMDAARHDTLVAFTSHLPHIAAYALCRTAAGDGAAEKRRLVAGSFRDMTRIAGSNARDWAAICSSNAAALKGAVGAYIRELRKAQRRLQDTRETERFFRDAQRARQRLLPYTR